jgi:hypothetical protein
MNRKYILTPHNEGVELACRVRIKCSKREAFNVASKMAAEIQASLLLQCDIAVHIQTEPEGLRGDEGITALNDGRFIDAKTGNFVKI